MIATVPQTPVIFPATVRDNVIYGLDLNSDLTTSDSVERAARKAGIHEFIMSLPVGYETVIGDAGLGISGEQAQRIVLARALVRKPRILILDETTSALDGESAALVLESVMKLMLEGRQTSQRSLTVIMITHSSKMEFADNVLVLEHGCVVKQGGFQELLQKGAGGRLYSLLKIDAAVDS